MGLLFLMLHEDEVWRSGELAALDLPQYSLRIPKTRKSFRNDLTTNTTRLLL